MERGSNKLNFLIRSLTNVYHGIAKKVSERTGEIFQEAESKEMWCHRRALFTAGARPLPVRRWPVAVVERLAFTRTETWWGLFTVNLVRLGTYASVDLSALYYTCIVRIS